MLGQQVDGGAERRVGCDRRKPVRSTALQADRDMARRHRFAPAFVGLDKHLFDDGDARFDRFPGAAAFLHDHGAQLRPFDQILRAEQPADLAAFAAETDNKRARDVGVADIAGEGPLQQIHRLAGHLHAAAQRMGEGGDTVDIGVAGEPLLREMIGDLVHDGGRTVHRRDDGDEVARPGASVRSEKALKRCPLGFR